MIVHGTLGKRGREFLGKAARREIVTLKTFSIIEIFKSSSTGQILAGEVFISELNKALIYDLLSIYEYISHTYRVVNLKSVFTD